MDDSQFRQIIDLLNGIVAKINQLEAELKKSTPTVTERLQAVGGSKSSTLANLPTIGSLMTKEGRP